MRILNIHGANDVRLDPKDPPKPGDKVVVFGCGPIGLGIVIWLVDRGVTDVVALDLVPERAAALGARAVIDPTSEDVRARLSRMASGSWLVRSGQPVMKYQEYSSWDQCTTFGVTLAWWTNSKCALSAEFSNTICGCTGSSSSRLTIPDDLPAVTEMRAEVLAMGLEDVQRSVLGAVCHQILAEATQGYGGGGGMVARPADLIPARGLSREGNLPLAPRK